MVTTLLSQLSDQHEFEHRHNGSSALQVTEQLAHLNMNSIDALIDQIIPQNIRLSKSLDLPDAKSEAATLSTLRIMADKNKVFRSFIGQGYYGTHTPAVILRNVLENPGWYTAYTPYQPEISQGRLQALLNYQQMVIDLTGLDIANASLLDEASAAAEAMALSLHAISTQRSKHSKSNCYFVSDEVHPQTIDVIKTKATFIGVELIIAPAHDVVHHDVFGALFQYPGTTGQIIDLRPLIEQIHQQHGLVTIATDLLALTLLSSIGEIGGDIAIGNSQRFGVPMGFGGPHAGFMAVAEKLKRNMPGRVIGVSVDRHGDPALRMSMQTREQHIRREKATSNICTAQALLANIAGFYAVYHGPDGLKKIARRVHHYASILAIALQQSASFRLVYPHYFDTLLIESNDSICELVEKALNYGFNLRIINKKQIAVSFDETTTLEDLSVLIELLGVSISLNDCSLQIAKNEFQSIPLLYQRQSTYLTHPVFNRYHSETQMMRYLKALENKDFSLTHGMIPLGSCTMKLNAAIQMIPITWREFGEIHPFAPIEQCSGYRDLIDSLSQMLCEITGYDAFSLQPNSGAQGEYAGLIAIQRYHQSRGDHHRNVCLIPSSAHGTNPASAAMVAMKVVVVSCDDSGNINLVDLQQKVEQYKHDLACIMITYPSTHGVYEESVKEVCSIIHQAGGQVYLDGANMNAQVALTSPGFIGADVSHLNLHKTFAIPHGGGGPGAGPIGVKSHLAPFLPGHVIFAKNHSKAQLSSTKSVVEGVSCSMQYAVSAAPYGSASILPISWSYIQLLGEQGLKRATQMAILNANYVMSRLKEYYPILYQGKNGWVAHECIIDIRPLKASSGITEEDIAKRLMDYGFHAPTMSFPVAGTLMIEPTESEDKRELDRFCDAMIQIRGEIDKVQAGVWSIDDNPLVNAPHTQKDLMSEQWVHPYSREIACFPSSASQLNKYWPTVARVDNVYGDRHLVCSCPPIDEYI